MVVEPEDSGLRDRGVVNCAQLVTIQQAGPGSRLRPRPGQTEVRPAGRLRQEKMAEVDRALRYNLGL